MQIIKEYYKPGKGPPRFFLRTLDYSRSLDKFLALVEEGKKDFPMLSPEYVKIVHFGGDNYRYTWGIEFDWPVEIRDIPKAYKRIETLEFTL
jgi:hypothetical protein